MEKFLIIALSILFVMLLLAGYAKLMTLILFKKSYRVAAPVTGRHAVDEFVKDYAASNKRMHKLQVRTLVKYPQNVVFSFDRYDQKNNAIILRYDICEAKVAAGVASAAVQFAYAERNDSGSRLPSILYYIAIPGWIIYFIGLALTLLNIRIWNSMVLNIIALVVLFISVIVLGGAFIAALLALSFRLAAIQRAKAIIADSELLSDEVKKLAIKVTDASAYAHFAVFFPFHIFGFNFL